MLRLRDITPRGLYARTLLLLLVPVLLILGLMSMAFFKAALVGYYFMHVKFEGKWVFAMIIPACILAVLLVVALIPDVARDRSKDDLSSPDEDSALLSPVDSSLFATKVLSS